MTLSPTQQAVMEIVRERGRVTNEMSVLNPQTGKWRAVSYRTIHALAGKGLLDVSVKQGADAYIRMRGGRGYRREAVWEVTGYPNVTDTLSLVQRIAWLAAGQKVERLPSNPRPTWLLEEIHALAKEAQIRLLGERHVKALLPSTDYGLPTTRALGRAAQALRDISAWSTSPRSAALEGQSLTEIVPLATAALKAIKETKLYVETRPPEEET